jgi:hypothetical protein
MFTGPFGLVVDAKDKSELDETPLPTLLDLQAYDYKSN